MMSWGCREQCVAAVLLLHGVTTVSANCGGTFTALEGSIQSPNYPANYDNNMNCSYYISVPPEYRITLNFSDFQLQDANANGVCSDVVQIYELFAELSRIKRTLCGNISDPPLARTLQNQMLIRFTSDSTSTFHGFNASYTTDTLGHHFALVIDSSKECIRWVDFPSNTYSLIWVQVSNPTAVDYDFLDKRVYFIQQDDIHIYSAFLNSTDKRAIRKLGEGVVLSDIAVDSTSRLIFYMDTGNDVIGVVTTTGAFHKRLIVKPLEQKGELALDTKRGFVFWTNGNNIQRANYDGTDLRTLIELTAATTLQSITLDILHSYLYWSYTTRNGKSALESSDLNGAAQTLIFPGEIDFFQIGYFDNMIYLFQNQSNSTHPLVVVYSLERGSSTAYGQFSLPFNTGDIALYKDSKNREQSKCEASNGGCDHICIPTSDDNIRCQCSDGYILAKDNSTCEQTSEPSKCEVSNGGCDHACTLTADNNVACQCSDGYMLASDNRTCDEKHDNSHTNAIIIGAVTGGAGFVLIVCAIIAVVICRRTGARKQTADCQMMDERVFNSQTNTLASHRDHVYDRPYSTISEQSHNDVKVPGDQTTTDYSYLSPARDSSTEPNPPPCYSLHPSHNELCELERGKENYNISLSIDQYIQRSPGTSYQSSRISDLK